MALCFSVRGDGIFSYIDSDINEASMAWFSGSVGLVAVS